MSQVYKISYVIQDAKGAQSTLSVNVPVSTTNSITTLQTQAIALGSTIEALATGVIKSCSVSVPVNVTAFEFYNPNAWDNSDVEEGALFIFSTSAGTKTRVRIPTATPSIFLPSGGLELGEYFVDQFIERMTTVYPFSDARGEDITTFVEGREDFKKSR